MNLTPEIARMIADLANTLTAEECDICTKMLKLGYSVQEVLAVLS